MAGVNLSLPSAGMIRSMGKIINLRYPGSVDIVSENSILLSVMDISIYINSESQ